MLSRKTETKGGLKQALLLISGLGGLFLLILFIFLAGTVFKPGNSDPISLARLTTIEERMPESIQTILVDQGQAMGIPLESGSQAYWYLARAGGIIAYILLWLATCWGIMMSSKIIKGYINFAEAFALHEFLPILGVVFTAIHALMLLGDSYVGFNLWQLLIPFTSAYKPFWTGLGSLALYLFLAIILSFYLRKQIGQKSWRRFHYTSYLAFLLALLHGLMAGTDSDILAIRILYLVTGGIALFLVYYRALSHTPTRTRVFQDRIQKEETQSNA
jgi:methionine sulfoxide reductase heme-binding subunit